MIMYHNIIHMIIYYKIIHMVMFHNIIHMVMHHNTIHMIMYHNTIHMIMYHNTIITNNRITNFFEALRNSISCLKLVSFINNYTDKQHEKGTRISKLKKNHVAGNTLLCGWNIAYASELLEHIEQIILLYR